MYKFLHSNFGRVGGRRGLANQVPPSINGTVIEGQELTVEPGIWSHQGPLTLDYQWLADGIAINNATTEILLIDASLVNSQIAVEETATDNKSTQTLVSASVQAPPATDPVFVTQPIITPTSGDVGTSFTLDLGTANSDNSVTITVETLTLDGVDVTGALSGNSWNSSGFDPGVLSLLTRATDDVTGLFALSDTVQADLIAVSSGSVTVTDNGSGSVIISVDEEIGSVTVSGSSLSEQNGTYSYDLNDLDLGPVNLVPPVIVNQSDPGQPFVEGDVVEKIDGLWLYRVSDGVPIIANSWKLTGSLLVGETSDTISTTALFTSLGGLSVSESASNATGQRSVSVDAIPEPLFDQTMVNIADGVIDTGIAADNSSTAFLLAVSGVRIRVDFHRQALIAASNGFRVYLATDEHIWKDINYVGENELLWGVTDTVGVGDAFNLLVSVEIGRARQVAVQKNQGPWVLYSEGDISNSSGIEMDFGSNFTIGLPTNGEITSGIKRLAFWRGATAPDITDANERSKFFGENGDVKHPSISNHYFGLPLIDIYGNAANYTGLINHGSGPNFISATGTYTDA